MKHSRRPAFRRASTFDVGRSARHAARGLSLGVTGRSVWRILRGAGRGATLEATSGCLPNHGQ
jgi:ribosomal protein S3